MDTRPLFTTAEALTAALGDVSGLNAVDLGAGSGAASRALAGLGARVTGIEPDAAARTRAVAAGGGPDYVEGTAEATGLPGRSADLVLFSMSLHHCADAPAALAEALRLLRPEGRLAVLEPEAPDPMWPVMRWIDDEAAAYAEAQAALAACARGAGLRARPTLRYQARYRVETVEDMIADLVAVDGTRRVDPEGRARMATAFAEAHRSDAEGGYLPFWLRLDTFEVPAEA
jgi:ubiquinone/menaquinone biosynthesis C-methylase UbiE